MSESLIDRVLGAVRFVDGSTRAHVTSALKLEADKPMTLRRNASGQWVIWRAAGLDAHTGHADGLSDRDLEALAAQPPALPAAESIVFTLRVEDPSGEYLPRRFEVRLPRAAPSLLEPITVALYRSTATRPDGAGARLYALVLDDASEPRRVVGARVTVTVHGAVVGRGVTGPTGEAVIEPAKLASFTTSGGGGTVNTDRIDAVARADVLLAVRDGAWEFEASPDYDSARFEGPNAQITNTPRTLHPGCIAKSEPVVLTAGRAARVTITVSPPR